MQKGSKNDDIENIKKAIKELKRLNIWVYLRMGLGVSNYKEVFDLYKFGLSENIDVFQIKPWVSSGYANKNRQTLCLEQSELYKVIGDFADKIHAEDSDMEVTISCYPLARKLGLDVKDCANVTKLYCKPDGSTPYLQFF